MKHKIVYFLFRTIGIVLCVLYWNENYFWWLMGSYIGLYLILVSVGVYYLKLNYFIKSRHTGENEGVILTFDDGPHPENTPKILATLEKYNVKATFFLIGKEAEKYPKIVKQIFDQGHIVGNHSYSHNKLLPFFFSKKLKANFDKSAQILKDNIGKQVRFIRPPFGVTSPRYRFLMKSDVVSIGWTFRSFDTMTNSVEQLIEKTENAVKSNKNAILLFHDTQNVTVDSLPVLLDNLKQGGTKIGILSESINEKAYV